MVEDEDKSIDFIGEVIPIKMVEDAVTDAWL